ncbi:hypothetical protein CYY_006592 [Polysphondylium violaceum]|uniref:RRM domain-containing protein n=1 Tax=Polysphondylium violaceum TaxID=133409 RepID=A0A8J4PQC9_9MYCE|nr:hypothetical protein CYY_006592 [Polysphondylium violaceum]
MSEEPDLDEFYSEINSTEDKSTDTTPTTTTTATSTSGVKRKLDDSSNNDNSPTTTTANKTTKTTTTTTVTPSTKLITPAAHLRKKILKVSATPTPSSVIAKSAVVVSSKPVTYSASTINILAESTLKPVAPPSYYALTKSQPMVTMEEPKKDKYEMKAAGQSWTDNSMSEWDPNDFRIFVGDLGNDVTDEMLKQAFVKYPSFLKAKVVRDPKTLKTKGFGFVSLGNSTDFLRALKEMNGKYVGARPIKLSKGTWQKRAHKV